MITIVRQFGMILLALLVLTLITWFSYNGIQAQMNRPMQEKEAEVERPDVSVITVKPEVHQAHVTAYGEANVHYSLTLTAQVAGQVDGLNKAFEPGMRVEKNEILVELENSDFRSAVATAENNLAAAKVSLLEEQRQVTQAENEWQSSGLDGTPESELVLRQPQLQAAKTAVKQAEAALASASKNLSRTHVIAPFDAIVVERLVSPGTFVQAGTTIATLFSTDYLELAIDLSARDWANLPEFQQMTGDAWPVELYSVENQQHWQGRVLRVEKHLDTSTRQRSLIVAVDQPFDLEPALYPGTFLKVKIAGRNQQGLWKLPNSALSQRSEIWFVSEDETLDNFSADPLFTDSESIYIKVPEALALASQQVLVHPLSSYLKGMPVNTIVVDESE